jgi:hypothetical protein
MRLIFEFCASRAAASYAAVAMVTGSGSGGCFPGRGLWRAMPVAVPVRRVGGLRALG